MLQLSDFKNLLAMGVAYEDELALEKLLFAASDKVQKSPRIAPVESCSTATDQAAQESNSPNFDITSST